MNDDTAISVKNVSKTFKLPHEKTSSIKSVFVNFYRRNKSFELQKALEDVSFEIKKGEFFGIVGRNGSGKSTMLKLLAGIYSPSQGTVRINGKLTPFIELGVGFNPELTGRENVYLNGALLGFSRKEMRRMYKSIVEFAELERFMDQKLKNYSSGMQVRLAFSIAVRAKTDILVLDEVLAVGDASFQKKCYDYFKKIKKDKKTVVLVSHDMDAIKKFCTRAALVTQGKVSFIGAPAQVAEQYIEQNKEGRPAGEGNDVIILTGARISSLQVTNSKDKEFKLGDEVKVRLVAEVDKTIKAKVGLQILKESGEMVAGVASDLTLGPDTLRPGKPTAYEYVFQSDQLTEGKFTIEGAIYDAKDSSPIFYKTGMESFTTKGHRGWGMFNLRGAWKRVK